MTELTTLLQAAQTAKSADEAINRLFATLYEDLRHLARSRLRMSDVHTSMDTTGLVHESYLRFLKAGSLVINDRPHFLSYASRVMRSIVVDIIRRRMADKNGGDARHVTLNTDIAESVEAPEMEVLRIHDALGELGAISERLVQVVEMRYFGGLTEAEVAEVLGVTTRTVGRDWEKAKYFLYRALQ